MQLQDIREDIHVDVSKATGSRYSVLGFDASGKKIVDSGWQTGKHIHSGKMWQATD